MSDRQYFFYILASRSRVLYIGATNNLERRLFEHRHKLAGGFTSKYRVDRLAYFETTGDVLGAIAREKQLRGWLRARNVALIGSINPTWRDLSEDWNTEADSSASPQNEMGRARSHRK